MQSPRALLALAAIIVFLGCIEGVIGGDDVVDEIPAAGDEEDIIKTTTTTLPPEPVFDPESPENVVAVDEGLLEEYKRICSPHADDGTPNCADVYSMDDSADESLVLIKNSICPRDPTDFARIVSLKEGEAELRNAYYCLKENRFWVFDLSPGQVIPSWYGPFDGYPVPAGEAPSATVSTRSVQTTVMDVQTTIAPLPQTTTTLLSIGDHDWEIDTASCDIKGVSFWRALCYDELAYMLSDVSLCRTVYCRARFLGEKVCDGVEDDSMQWRQYRKTACKGWVQRSPFVCDHIVKSEDCIKWYSVLAGDFVLCGRADRGDNNCAWLFAYWRGEDERCWEERTLANRKFCQSMYHKMSAMDKALESECRKVQGANHRQECVTAAKGLIDPTSDIYMLKNELVGD